MEVIRPFYYWITARAEVPLHRFVTEVIYPAYRLSDREVRIEEAASWLDRQVQLSGKAWTASVNLKGARALLATLRDFGILEGRVRKRIASTHLPPEAFALIAFSLHELGVTGRELVQHPDWQLFLLGEAEVERLFLECHGHHWLRFELAGSVCRIEFPDVSFEEFARGVLS